MLKITSGKSPQLITYPSKNSSNLDILQIQILIHLADQGDTDITAFCGFVLEMRFSNFNGVVSLVGTGLGSYGVSGHGDQGEEVQEV